MFFRKGTETGQRAPARSSATEAQLRELRVKARRRLIGALALVLAAFIIVPWLFDEPVTDDAHAPIVVPAPVAGLPPVTEPVVPPSDAASGVAQTDTPADTTLAASTAEPAEPAQPASPAQPPVPAAAPQSAPAPAEPVRNPPEPAHEKPAVPASKPADARPGTEKPAPTRSPAERTDDGSVALALLAGKTPSAARAESKPASEGHYYLQVAAYTTEQDANARRDSLRQAGVTDAYVERGQSNGRTVYRLRVGPFGSHEAAQAAQTRLRALGYQNGLISGK
jgi:DedD protein